MRRDPILAADVANSDVVSIDGMGIIWGARCVGLPANVRVTGIDLLAELLAVCADEGFKPYFLGATPQIAHQAARRVREKHPSIQFSGVRDGYFSADQEAQVVNAIRNSKADCLFIGMPTPRKSDFSRLIVTNSTFLSLWELAAHLTFSPAKFDGPLLECSSLDWNGSTESTRNRGGCGGDTQRLIRCLPEFWLRRLFSKDFQPWSG